MAAAMTRSPMCRWPATPALAPSTTLRPSVVLPAMPVWATRMEFSPMTTLWPTMTRLSIFTPDLTQVVPKAARSTQELAPTSTSSSRRTVPTCGLR